MQTRWHLDTNNGGWLRPATIRVSTVEMPRIKDFDFGYRYESCLFTGSDSEVLERYNTVSEAVQGHRRLTVQYGLTEQ